MVVFGQSGYTRDKCVYSGKSGSNLGKVVVFEQRASVRTKVVLFG